MRSKLFILLILVGCSSQKIADAASAENQLCKVRAEFRIAELADVTLVPSPGSLRAKIEDAEDAFCLPK